MLHPPTRPEPRTSAMGSRQSQGDRRAQRKLAIRRPSHSPHHPPGQQGRQAPQGSGPTWLSLASTTHGGALVLGLVYCTRTWTLSPPGTLCGPGDARGESGVQRRPRFQQVLRHQSHLLAPVKTWPTAPGAEGGEGRHTGPPSG